MKSEESRTSVMKNTTSVSNKEKENCEGQCKVGVIQAEMLKANNVSI